MQRTTLAIALCVIAQQAGAAGIIEDSKARLGLRNFYINADGATAYLITDRQIGKFLSAGERTWLAEYGYDFASAGVPGLKATVTYLSGDNIDNAASDRKEWERDFRLDYTLQQGALKGLGFSWRNASFRSNVATNLD
ncbi:outer membrane porin, OprD family [compost metagenome]